MPTRSRVADSLSLHAPHAQPAWQRWELDPGGKARECMSPATAARLQELLVSGQIPYVRGYRPTSE